MNLKNIKGASVFVMFLLSFWFVSYQWADKESFGAGNICLELKTKYFDIAEVEKYLKEKNKYTAVVIMSFIQINKETYTPCSNRGGAN